MKCIKPANANHLSGYRTTGCRCEACREANRVAMKAWRYRTGRTKHRLVKISDAEREEK